MGLFFKIANTQTITYMNAKKHIEAFKTLSESFIKRQIKKEKTKILKRIYGRAFINSKANSNNSVVDKMIGK